MSTKNSLHISSLLIVVGVLGRAIPHLPNATPVTAIALFATTYLGLRYSSGVLLLTMLIADIFIGFYQWQIMFTVYASLVIAIIFGLIIRKYKSFPVILSSTLLSSALFFITTNWAVWQFGTMYTHSFSGLVESYTMALPFLKNSLIGDLIYTGMFFGLFEGAKFFITERKKRVGKSIISI